MKYDVPVIEVPASSDLEKRSFSSEAVGIAKAFILWVVLFGAVMAVSVPTYL